MAVAAVAGLMASTRPAEAQLLPQMSDLHPSFYGSAEADTRESQFYLLGMYLGVGGLGWSPYFNVNGYNLHYRLTAGGEEDRTLSAVSPTVGIAYAGRNAGISFGGGYTWVDNEDPGAPGAEGGGSNGASASIGVYHIGKGRRPSRSQLLSNYNFGSQYLWARARASVPFGRSPTHPTRIGLEIVGQGGGKDGRTSNTFQAGPTFEYSWSPSLRTTGVVGYKTVGGETFATRESAGYLKLEFSFSP